MTRPRSVVAGAAAVVALILLSATPVAAYSPSTAAAWADQWATSRNCSYGPCFPDDCTAFVSQDLERGGYALVGLSGSATDDHNWWAKLLNGAWANTHSWSVANDQFTFQMWHYPGGGVVATKPGQSATVSSGGQVGDLLFYDWQSDGYKDHVGIQVVVNGRDPNSGWYGDLQDQHTTDRYHAFWSLWPYDSMASSTTIYVVHISTAN